MNSQTGAASGLADGQGAYAAVAKKIKNWGQELGFAAIGIARADVSAAAPWLMRWLALGRHGEMDYMAKHAALRTAPQQLLPGTLSVISARLPYWPAAVDAQQGGPRGANDSSHLPKPRSIRPKTGGPSRSGLLAWVPVWMRSRGAPKD